MGRGGGHPKAENLGDREQKKEEERADGAAHGHGKVPQLEFAIGHLFFSQRDGKNGKNGGSASG